MSIEQVSASMAAAQTLGDIKPKDFATNALTALQASAKPMREPPPTDVAVPQCAAPLEPNDSMLKAAAALGYALSTPALTAIYKAMIAAR